MNLEWQTCKQILESLSPQMISVNLSDNSINCEQTKAATSIMISKNATLSINYYKKNKKIEIEFDKQTKQI